MIFETQVTNIGPEAEMFRQEKMLIFFGNEAPETLADYCYNIQLTPSTDEITTGMDFLFDNQAYKITAVGDVVKKNLDDLGHITLRFDGSETAELPGTLYVEDKELPVITVGTKIMIK
ncbi:PTS glucitol/sorbitol transporter subunit IIA [Enterococcus dongliensis]|uniref:PTS glucitol/sorbitol transporter subunit IIA n=1 Tax=Enterococcus dongliensis TaxID=2559925 RepID=A0AAP5KU61_9ENTE|nr:PTS glucitol/sorbitol transporter subunit IIA [Enterococcus dongliensis]MDT2596402.1 PTS glucitol/sorbitol transporter subunit IIA [Enterococcus dongliensis]MDT2603752.1 PTS glucitol/sorbitol transporter subunit IIA [Enterococcus dongliensis]MDT2634093.1 PTS glucitol/sorbitol transporter subunit IIA [Enterococcus dongliensis]MDT2637023.1 PTS glucitol/sorbitol transporter subunit IIA [Enterococcus dongliensis]MDT2640231.1 PTS glucitol/sorbitol transporter subunit IIA [Enterococcus dongliensi